jgi:hypothetical protein
LEVGVQSTEKMEWGLEVLVGIAPHTQKKTVILEAVLPFDSFRCPQGRI